ncbi:MAG: hypothetical protein ACRDF4_02655, partial [Rhabdochlamydiaceae bacterium]
MSFTMTPDTLMEILSANQPIDVRSVHDRLSAFTPESVTQSLAILLVQFKVKLLDGRYLEPTKNGYYIQMEYDTEESPVWMARGQEAHGDIVHIIRGCKTFNRTLWRLGDAVSSNNDLGGKMERYK